MAPHPDDEIICCGGLMRRVLAEGGQVDIVYFTEGDGYVEGVAFELRQSQPRPELFVEYGEWRRRESIAVLTLLRLPEKRAHFLGFPDGGLREIWERHFSEQHPYESHTTAAAHVPYRHSVEPGAPYSGIELQGLLRQLLHDLKPTLVVLPDPRDQHGDHSATGLFTLEAFHDYAQAEEGRPSARVLTYLVHWPRWPGPSVEPPLALVPPADLSEAPIDWISFPLTAAESADKLHVLHVYKTQVDVMGPFLDRFYRKNELFGEFRIDPPPEGLILSPLAYQRPKPKPH
jgi:LmbE family N-acetylglucosaminyl deacetylase